MKEVPWRSIIADGIMIKATLSKPRRKGNDLVNVYLKPTVIKDSSRYQAVYRYKTRDETHNHDFGAAVAVLEELLDQVFYNIDLYTETHQYTLLQSRKGSKKWLAKALVTTAPPAAHDHRKTRLVETQAPWLQALGLASAAGEVYADGQRKYRQINRYVELVSHLLPDTLPSTISIADMGSGKGYLTFALYDYLVNKGSEVTFVGVEMRPDLVTKCNIIATAHDMTGLTFVEGSIDSVDVGKRDMVIALHACDIATDMAIANAVRADAQYIVLAPCCHKQIRREMSPDQTAMAMLRHGILMEREAEMVTDAIRALLLESLGYRTQVIEWISGQHTSKNIMITAVKTTAPRQGALAEVHALKERYGIKQHYLETVLPE